jgi:hypothetical protein
MLQLSSDRRANNTSRQLPELQSCQGRDAEEEVQASPGNNQRKVFSSSFTTPKLFFAAALLGKTEEVTRTGTRREAGQVRAIPCLQTPKTSRIKRCLKAPLSKTKDEIYAVKHYQP